LENDAFSHHDRRAIAGRAAQEPQSAGPIDSSGRGERDRKVTRFELVAAWRRIAELPTASPVRERTAPSAFRSPTRQEGRRLRSRGEPSCPPLRMPVHHCRTADAADLLRRRAIPKSEKERG
jgi:hypothetical protein